MWKFVVFSIISLQVVLAANNDIRKLKFQTEIGNFLLDPRGNIFSTMFQLDLCGKLCTPPTNHRHSEQLLTLNWNCKTLTFYADRSRNSWMLQHNNYVGQHRPIGSLLFPTMYPFFFCRRLPMRKKNLIQLMTISGRSRVLKVNKVN